MGNPRKPAAMARVTGATLKNPSRHIGRATPKVKEIGPPPKRLGKFEVEAWRELVAELPWLSDADRTLVELASRLKARMVTDPDVAIAALAQLRMCLSAMGATPADRTKVSTPKDDDDEDPAAEFLN